MEGPKLNCEKLWNSPEYAKTNHYNLFPSVDEINKLNPGMDWGRFYETSDVDNVSCAGAMFRGWFGEDYLKLNGHY